MTAEPSHPFAQSDQQARGREYDPCSERGHAGKQQDFIQESDHCSLPRAASPTRRDRSALLYLGQKVTADRLNLGIGRNRPLANLGSRS